MDSTKFLKESIMENCLFFALIYTKKICKPLQNLYMINVFNKEI